MSRTPTTRFYQVRGEHREWARIWITDDGCISIMSDFGNWGYWFGSPGCEFRKFLTRCDDDYISKKLADGEREYDGERTFANVRREIIRLRRDGLSAELARHEWELCERFSKLENREDFALWQAESVIDPSELASFVYPFQLQHFVKRLWPLFVMQLRAEIEREAA